MTTTGFGLQPTGAPTCLSPFTIVFQTTGGSVIETLYDGAPPTNANPNPSTFGAFTAPNVVASTYEIEASCPEPTAGPPVTLSAINYFILTAPPPPTTTTTTTSPPTTTTVPPTTTTTQAGVTSTTKPRSGTSTTKPGSSTTTTTTPGAPTTTTTTVPKATQALLLSAGAIPSAGSETATGHGCNSLGAVLLTVDTRPVGRRTAGADGSYSAPLLVSSLPVGRYQVVACR